MTDYKEEEQNLHHVDATQPTVTAPSCQDVISGRGKRIQCYAGNVKYRTLVSINKALYAICPASDKEKISKSIVAAFRATGGRFLEKDKHSLVYKDIGDKKAIKKTSQALREGQPKIRKEIYQVEEMKGGKLLEMAEMPAEEYFRYSVRVLKSLNEVDTNGVLKNTAHLSASAAITMALDQFPGLAHASVAATLETRTSSSPSPVLLASSTHQTQIKRESSHASLGCSMDGLGVRPTISCSTNTDHASIFSFNCAQQLLVSLDVTAMKDSGKNIQGYNKSVKTEPEMNLDDTSDGMMMTYDSHIFDDQYVSPQLTDFSEYTNHNNHMFDEEYVSPRLTGSSECTHCSKTSLMEASITTFRLTDDMSIDDERTYEMAAV